MAHMHAIESEPPRPPVEAAAEPIAEISATLLRAQAFLAGCGIALLVREGGWLVCRGSSGAASPETGTRIPVENTFLGLCISLKKPQSCEDADSDPRVEDITFARLRPKSIVAVPVRAGQEVIAVLAGFSSAPSAFTNTQVALLRTVADSLSRPVQQLPLSPPSEEPPPAPVASQPSLVISREPARETPAKRETRPAPPPEPPAPPPPTTGEQVLALADDVAPMPRMSEPRLSPPTVRVVTYSVPQFSGLVRARRRRLRATLLRIAAVTAACLLCALATVGWYSSKVPDVPRFSATPSAPAVIQAAPAEPVAAPTVEAAALVPAAPAAELAKAEAVVAPAEPAPAKPAIVEPPTRASASLRLPVAPAYAAEAPTLALSGTAGMPTLLAPQAVAPKIHHSVAVPARLEHRVPPQFPVLALKRRIAGEVTLALVVRKDGSVADVKQVSGNPLFRDSAIDAVKKWRYSPATLDGQPVEANAQVRLKFDLPAGSR